MKNNWYRQTSLFSSPPKQKPPRKKWRVHYVLWNALKRTCMVLGAFMLISAVMGAVFSSFAVKEVSAPKLPDEMVLTLVLDKPMVEHADMFGAYGFGEPVLTMRDVTDAIDGAAADSRVKGFAMRLDGVPLSLAHAEELRTAILRFRESGKFTWVYAQSYERLSNYYLASAFDKIWLQPAGIVSIAGINAEIPFARRLLDKIGIEPQIFARKEYKNFFESATSTQMSPASREMMDALIGDLGTTLMGRSAAGRMMTLDEFRVLVDQGLFAGEEALKANLIDVLAYGDEFNSDVKELVTGDPDYEDELFVGLGRYSRQDRADHKFVPPGGKKPKVALVYAVGNIVKSDDGGSLAASDTLVGTIREAADADDIDVIVLRVDSPGGDPAAAEAIRRAVIKAKEKGKKIVVSMGDAAASGGYWIAADADYIFALPVTMTGSIGVTGGKFSLARLWEKIGVNWDRVSVGENSSLWSFNRPYTDGERARMNVLMDSVYNRFIQLVANGRGMSVEQVDKIAGGRVWTGVQAQEVGLVDALGGLDAALDYAAGLTGAKDRSAIRVIVMPEPKTAFEKVLSFLEQQAAMGHFFQTHIPALTAIGAMVDEASTYSDGAILLR